MNWNGLSVATRVTYGGRSPVYFQKRRLCDWGKMIGPESVTDGRHVPMNNALEYAHAIIGTNYVNAGSSEKSVGTPHGFAEGADCGSDCSKLAGSRASLT